MMNVERRQAAADTQTRPNDLGCESACSHTLHRHLLLLLGSKADTHFTIPRRVEGWVDLASDVSERRIYHNLTVRQWYHVKQNICKNVILHATTSKMFLKMFYAKIFVKMLQNIL